MPDFDAAAPDDDWPALVCAYILDGKGGAKRVSGDGLASWTPKSGPLWVHINLESDEEANRVLDALANLDPFVHESLLAKETRPRVVLFESGFLLTIRGVNLNPGADPEDMVALRLWIEKDRVISSRTRRLLAVNDVRDELEHHYGPSNTADWLVRVVQRLVERMGPVVSGVDDEVDELEDKVLSDDAADLRSRIGGVRRQAISLRRYLAPQRDVVMRLAGETLPGFDPSHRSHLREVADTAMRYVEDLDAARERASVVHEELANRIGERLNRTMYVLSLVATVFLPLSFITGLLGINVGGIPGADNARAFLEVSGILAVLALVELWIFRRLRFI